MLPQHYERYKHIRASTTRYYVAANLFNSARVVPNLCAQILLLADYLGPGRVFVSVYENGSGIRFERRN